MGKRDRNFVNIIRQQESSKDNNNGNIYGIVSSVSKDGKNLNVQTYQDGESRVLNTVAPYGISSSALKGLRTQVVLNDNDNNSCVGVFDDKKPSIEPGEVCVYHRMGMQIYLRNDGNIDIKSNGGKLVINIAPDESINMFGKINMTGEININGTVNAICAADNGDSFNVNGTTNIQKINPDTDSITVG